MAHLSTKAMEVDLVKGFSLFMVLRVAAQKHAGRKILYHLRGLFGASEVSVGLDNSDHLRVWVVDSSGVASRTGGIQPERFVGKSVILQVQLQAQLPSGLRTRLEVSPVDVVKEVLPATFHGPFQAKLTIGANANGQDAAAFDVAEILQYENILASSDLRALLRYLSEKYALPAA